MSVRAAQRDDAAPTHPEWAVERLLETTADDGEQACRALAAVLEQQLAARVSVLIDRGDGWQRMGGGLSVTAADLARLDDEPEDAAGSGESDRALGTLEPISVAGIRVTVVADDEPIDVRLGATARKACVWVGLHAQSQAAAREVTDVTREADVLRAVSEQLRSMRDLDQVLLSITRSTLELLESDICGVLLREEETLVMRCCVGHEVAETSRLRMRRGQGVAGLVFETGRPGKVDDYLADGSISQDFVALAEQEATRSALAVPLMLQGEIIGVLEVWRRRASVFAERDVQRLVTLADFASIAIDNATLYATQHRMLGQLEQTRSALENEVAVSRSTGRLQQALLDAVLDAPTPASVAEAVARQLHCDVAVYGADGSLDQLSRLDGSQPLPPSLDLRPVSGAVEGEFDGAQYWAHPILVEGRGVGAVALTAAAQPAEVARIACAQVALACALAYVQQQAASRARAEALDQALWDLVEGRPEHRTAARGRIHQMGVDLSGRRLVLVGRVALDEDGGGEALVRRHTSLLRALRATPGTHRNAIIGIRPERVVAVVPPAPAAELRSLLEAWSEVLREFNPAVEVTWGVSGDRHTVTEVDRGYEEARLALTAATRMGLEHISFFDDLGIVRLLLGSGSEPDVKSFTDDVTGPLLAYDREHEGSLVRTLGAFFDSNCSQKVAAARLFIHHKTMRYRLEQIKTLTGLDLAQHDDRVRADIALRILQVGETQQGHD